MTSTSNASMTATLFFGLDFPCVENEADVPLLTSFPSLIILASVQLEITVTDITLEPTLFKGIFMLFLASSDINVHILLSRILD
jgi:hypothetical protein